MLNLAITKPVSYTHLDVYKRQVVRDPPKKVIESDEPLSKDVIRAVIASGCSYTNCPEILTNIHRKRTVVRSLAVGPEMVCEECGYFCFEVGGERYEIEMPIIKNNGFDLISITAVSYTHLDVYKRQVVML